MYGHVAARWASVLFGGSAGVSKPLSKVQLNVYRINLDRVTVASDEGEAEPTSVETLTPEKGVLWASGRETRLDDVSSRGSMLGV